MLHFFFNMNWGWARGYRGRRRRRRSRCCLGLQHLPFLLCLLCGLLRALLHGLDLLLFRELALLLILLAFPFDRVTLLRPRVATEGTNERTVSRRKLGAIVRSTIVANFAVPDKKTVKVHLYLVRNKLRGGGERCIRRSKLAKPTLPSSPCSTLCKHPHESQRRIPNHNSGMSEANREKGCFNE